MVSTNYKWVTISSDSSEIEMELFLDRQKDWRKKTSQHEPCQVCPMRFTQHTMHYAIYRCTARSCADRADPCEWFLRTTLCDVSKRGRIEQHGQHVSSVVDKCSKKLNLQMKRFIRDKVKDKLKPSRILNAMTDARLFGQDTDAAELLRPVTRFAHHYRTHGLGDNNGVDEAEALLANRPFHPDLPDTAAFAFGFSTAASGQPTLSRGTAQRPVGFATKRTLRNLAHAREHILHVDATFKLNTARFPSVIIRVSDVHRQFHPVAFFIVSDVRQQQLEAVFHETFKMFEVVTGSKAHVAYAMADVDVAQRNALEVVVAQELQQITPPVFLMCFFHVMQNVRKYISSVPEALRPQVHKHVYRIHYARSDSDLDHHIAEAVAAWKNEVALRDFERRFSQQWLSGRFTLWQCLWTPSGFAKTNNPVEQVNREIKRDYSLRTLLSVNALAQAFLDMCHHRSCRAMPFETSAVPSSAQARRYRQLMKQGRLAVKLNQPGSIAFLIEGEILRVFQTRGDVVKPTRKKPLTTQEELDRADGEVETENQPPTGWIVDVEALACSCRNRLKFGYCVHLIAARVEQDLPVPGVKVKRSFEVKGKKQGKGRPAQVGHALSNK